MSDNYPINYNAKYSMVICIFTMLAIIVTTSIIASELIEWLTVPTDSANNWVAKRSFTTILDAGVFLVVSLFAYCLHKRQLNK